MSVAEDNDVRADEDDIVGEYHSVCACLGRRWKVTGEMAVAEDVRRRLNGGGGLTVGAVGEGWLCVCIYIYNMKIK